VKYQTDDVRITGMEEVIPPQELLQAISLTNQQTELVFNTREQISKILSGEDPRLLVIIGPCSIHDPKAALEYADRLTEQAARLDKSLCVVMRTYFEKPRTTVGWKGLLNDPYLNNSYNINEGLRIARELVAGIIERGIGVGTEFLDPITPQYLSDLVSWGAIGARTTESQVHRQLASGLSCPIGFKNSTDGSVQVAVDAVGSATHQHIFLSVTKAGHSAIFSTSGNPDCHIILRGGGGKTNFDNPSIHYASRILEQAGLTPKVMIDMSHANSEKQHKNQIKVCQNICSQLRDNESRISGVMIESHLIEGNQKISTSGELTYGQSITDACIGWEDSVSCLEELASASESRIKNFN